MFVKVFHLKWKGYDARAYCYDKGITLVPFTTMPVSHGMVGR